MTREEAIDILESRSVCMECVISKYDCDACDEAFKMAISALEQEPCDTSTDEPMTMVYPTIFCDDAISREAVRQGMLKYGFTAPDMTVHEFVEDELPSVQPSRKGHWELLANELYMCSECNAKWTMRLNFCPNCGADMRGDTE